MSAFFNILILYDKIINSICSINSINLLLFTINFTEFSKNVDEMNSFKNPAMSITYNDKGKGTPDHQGKWNLPCGYLDWDEYAEEAISREVFEETGYSIPPNLFNLWTVDSNPKRDNQSVVLRYYVDPLQTDNLYFSGHLKPNKLQGEKDEVEEIDWILIDELNNYVWAFDHIDIILKAFTQFIN